MMVRHTCKLGLTRLGRERTLQLSTFASQSHLHKKSGKYPQVFGTKFFSRLALNVKEEASRALERAESQAARAGFSVASYYLPACRVIGHYSFPPKRGGSVLSSQCPGELMSRGT